MPTTQTARPVIDPQNPWPGLESFPEEAERFFNGRDAERDELLRLIRRETLTLLYGQSGLGKSSLLMAGLFPLLRREHYLPVYVRLDHAETSPPHDAQLRARLLEACRERGVEAPEPRPGESTWELLHRSDGFWDAKNYPVTPILVIDQFEEIFTLGATGATREARSRRFLAELGDLIDNRPPEALLQRLAGDPDGAGELAFSQPAYKVVLSLREDYLPELGRLREHTSSTMQNYLRLLRMRGDRALEAVRTTGGELVEDEAAQVIVRFLARAVTAEQGGGEVRLGDLEIEPALLSVFCRELNQRRRDRGLPRITADLLPQNQTEILATFYDRAFDGMDPGMRVFVEEELLTDSGYHRNSTAYEDALARPGVSAAAIETLVQRRLLRLEERFGAQRVELTHDVLTDVVRESRDRRRAREKRRELQRARRRRITAIAATVIALLGGTGGALAYSAKETREAEDREAQAQKAKQDYDALYQTLQVTRTTLEAQQLEAERMAARARTDSARAAAAQVLVDQQRESLRVERAATETARARADESEQEARVGSEAALYYRATTGRLIERRVAADAGLEATALAQAADAARVRQEALETRQAAETRARDLERVLCLVMAGNSIPDTAKAVKELSSALNCRGVRDQRAPPPQGRIP